MRVIGIDLSGPSNHKDTVLSVFEKRGDQLTLIKWMSNMSDENILRAVSEQCRIDEVVIGIDSPLSYEDGGGDRQSDRELRKFVIGLGMKSGSIMTPTYTRMVYLTLRGIKLTREIGTIDSTHAISIVEVHPGAVIGARLLREEMDFVLRYKQDRLARVYIRKWLEKQGLKHMPVEVEEGSHSIDACAAALGAWHWKDEAHQPKWLYTADPPLHPYDYCC